MKAPITQAQAWAVIAESAGWNAKELPVLPDHPEPRIMKWSALEIEAIQAYGAACAAHAREMALFTRPMPPQIIGLQDVHDAITSDPTLAESNAEFDESQFKSVEDLIAYLNKLNSYRDKTLEALSKYKGAK